MSVWGYLQQRLFRISLAEATFGRRGFPSADAGVQAHLEHAAQTFVRGYNLSLVHAKPEKLAAALREIELEFQGFAFEGAAMGLALLDRVLPGRRGRWRAFLAGPADPHAYMVHVGVGWAAARLPWFRRNLEQRLADYDPLLRWLVVDGYGFHEGFFHWEKSFSGQAVPPQLGEYARRAFDHGLGRSLWFVQGADPERIAVAVNAFPASRRGDLYSGLGLACTYAGGVSAQAIGRLRGTAGPHLAPLAQGAAFAAKARQRAGNLVPHTELACRVLCGMAADAAAAITDECLAQLPPDGRETAYEQWRQRIQERLTRPGFSSSAP
jgi:hypothetical protein